MHGLGGSSVIAVIANLTNNFAIPPTSEQTITVNNVQTTFRCERVGSRPLARQLALPRLQSFTHNAGEQEGEQECVRSRVRGQASCKDCELGLPRLQLSKAHPDIAKAVKAAAAAGVTFGAGF